MPCVYVPLFMIKEHPNSLFGEQYSIRSTFYGILLLPTRYRKTIKPKLNGFDYLLLVQQVGCFLPDLFLAAYTAGHVVDARNDFKSFFLAAYTAGHC